MTNIRHLQFYQKCRNEGVRVHPNDPHYDDLEKKEARDIAIESFKTCNVLNGDIDFSCMTVHNSHEERFNQSAMKIGFLTIAQDLIDGKSLFKKRGHEFNYDTCHQPICPFEQGI